MDEKERLINEVKGLLAGEKSSISKTKSIILDKKTKQLSIKIPKEIGSAGLLNEHTEVKIVFNPSKKNIEEAERSHFIIYGKEN